MNDNKVFIKMLSTDQLKQLIVECLIACDISNNCNYYQKHFNNLSDISIKYNSKENWKRNGCVYISTIIGKTDTISPAFLINDYSIELIDGSYIGQFDITLNNYLRKVLNKEITINKYVDDNIQCKKKA